MKLEHTYKSIEAISKKSSSVLLFCSLGKDSLVLLDLAYPKFDRIVCVFMYFVKGLEHIERYIKWLKAKYPNVEFVQVPHWNLSHILRSGLCCVPNPKVKLLKLADVEKSMKLKYGIDYVLYGMKKADSMNRRIMLNRMGFPYEQNGACYPLADWTQKEILSYMRQRKLPEPIRYSKKASGGVGLNIECFLWLRENNPEDLKKIVNVFPMAERMLFEHDTRNGNE